MGKVPQGLKPASIAAPNGTAEAVPYPKPIYETSSTLKPIDLGGGPGAECRRARRRKILVAIVALLSTTAAWGRVHRKPAAPASPSTESYVLALASANRFLHAWQAGNLADGMALVSDGIRHAQNAGELERFFSSETDRAFEIRTGRGGSGRYTFPVMLLSLRSPPGTNQVSSRESASRNPVVRRSSEIVMVNTGKNDWVVDKLP